jgi:hypothetical protein
MGQANRLQSTPERSVLLQIAEIGEQLVEDGAPLPQVAGGRPRPGESAAFHRSGRRHIALRSSGDAVWDMLSRSVVLKSRSGMAFSAAVSLPAPRFR